MMKRRICVLSALSLPPLWLLGTAQADERVAALLREGGVVLAFRHALAPGTFDPPQFRVDDCSTQRNLNDAGRDQARRMGQWMVQRNLAPAVVRSSPWCRCVDTANLAFGRAEVWAALGSPRGADEVTNAQSLRELRAAVAAAGQQRGRFEVWVTHQFVLSALVTTVTSSGEGLVLRAAQGGNDAAPEVLARLAAA
jgi:phosphohistidine phosphatase SixA